MTRPLWGLVLIVALGGWVLVSAATSAAGPGSGGRMLAALGAAAAAYAVGTCARARTVPVAAVLAIGCAVALLEGLRVLDRGRAGLQLIDVGPFDDLNASAQLAVQGVAAAGLVVLLARATTVRAAAVLVGGCLAVVPLVTGSWTATAGLGLVVLATVLAWRGRVDSRTAAAIGGTLVAAALLVSVVLAVTPNPAERRVELWSDAVSLVAEHPVAGVGPGRFAEVSVVASADPDTTAAHSVWLEAAAELGLPGVLLMLALAIWVWARVGPGPSGVVGAAALTAFGVHASVDHVADAIGLVVVVAALAGLTSGPDPDRGQKSSTSPSPRR